ncbi:MAG: ABC transporter permease, partial [Epsilonproteobacteria bacterium]|nr:ABC transporter permease [Campylobacterota bacterium]
SLIIFFKDMGEIVTMLLQFGFWMTPIFWSIDIVPKEYQFFLKLNPMYYIVEGYRDTFIHKVWFWQHPYLTLYFWIIALSVFAGGAIIFRKLRPHFADVL